MSVFKDLPVLEFADSLAFEAWLAKEYPRSEGIWLRLYNKGSGQPSITYPEALDVALCYGWIDSSVHKDQPESYLQKFTPRRSRSVWSKVNRNKVARLIEAGRMQAPGQREIDAAKADGRWDAAVDSPRTAEVPEDLAVALQSLPQASAFFESLSKTEKFYYIVQLQNAKKPETRQRRLANAVDRLQRGLKANDKDV